MKGTGLARGMISEVCLFVFLLLLVLWVGACVCVCVCVWVWLSLCFLVFVCVWVPAGFWVSGFVGFCVSWFGCVRVCVVVFLGFGDLCFCVNLGLPFRAANPGNHAHHE